MNYTIDIIDTVDEHVLSKENAAASSIFLNWKGNDNINENFIIGSSLQFTLLSDDPCLDQAFFDLLTKDENRFKIEINDEDNNRVWNGFLLPDFYEEPYEGAVTIVQFTATDGLGRLKGKYLDDSLYEGDRRVRYILSQVLKQTGLEMNYSFCPAIKNSERDNWDEIYIDSKWFSEDEEKKDAFAILDELLKSMMCSIYQRNDQWNIIGLNQQQNKFYNVRQYGINGEFITELPRERQIKNPIFLGDPVINSLVPYGTVDITSTQVPISVPVGLSSIENLGWSSNDVNLLAVEWEAVSRDNNFNTIPIPPLEGVFALSQNLTPLITKKSSTIHIKNRPFLTPGIYNFSFSLNAVEEEGLNNDVIDGYKAEGLWVNPIFVFALIYQENGEKNFLMSNSGDVNESYVRKDIDFTKEDDFKMSFLFTVYKGGFFDFTSSVISIEAKGLDKIEISEMTLEKKEFEEEKHAVIKNDGWTQKKEIDLPYTNDSSGISKAFKLQDTADPDGFEEIFSFPIKRRFFSENKWYLSIDLDALHLLDKYSEFNDSDYVFGPAGLEMEFEYNYLGSSEHFVIIEDPSAEYYPGFKIRVPYYDNTNFDRAKWEQWTDTFYKIERKKYPEVVASIYDRLQNGVFSSMHDVKVRGEVFFGDFVNFYYPKNSEVQEFKYTPWTITNLSWNIDKGITTLGLRKPYYNGDYNGLKGIALELGGDVFLNNQSISITPQIVTPSSFITTYLWEELTGNNIPNFDENASVLFVPGNNLAAHYKFRLTITDNYGQTAIDEVDVWNYQQTNIGLRDIDRGFTQGAYHYHRWRESRIQFSPSLDDGTLALVDINGTMIAFMFSTFSNTTLDVSYNLKINGETIKESTVTEEDAVIESDPSIVSGEYWTTRLLISNQDIVTIRTEIKLESNTDNWDVLNATRSEFEIPNAIFRVGYGDITGTTLYGGVSENEPHYRN